MARGCNPAPSAPNCPTVHDRETLSVLFSVDNDDSDFWLEQDEIERWIAAGAPPVEEWKRGNLPAASARAAPAETTGSKTQGPPRLAVNLEEAASVLGCKEDFFREQVKPELKIVRRGRRQFVAVRELERWLEESAARTFE